MYPFISVIVPVYNRENCIERIVASLASQTANNYEAIFIDDGSQDESGNLIDYFANKFPWIKAYHQNNRGVSAARNAGIRIAEGTHLVFLDSDDYFEKNTIEKLSAVIQKNEPDILVFGMSYVDKDDEKHPFQIKLAPNTLYCRDTIATRIIPCMINTVNDPEAFILDFSCGKVFKTEIVKKHSICFLETRRAWEDRPFVVNYLKYADTLYIIGECLYNYMYTPESLSTKFNPQFLEIILENYELYKKWYGEQYDIDTKYSAAYWSDSIDKMISRVLSQVEYELEAYVQINGVIHDCRVQHWFFDRDNRTPRDKHLMAMICAGDTESVIRFYKQEQKKQKRKQIVRDAKHKLKQRIKQIIQ